MNADFKQEEPNWINTDKFDVHLTYDLNGNIQSLRRESHLTTGAIMDDLVYDYSGLGNQLLSVTDNGNIESGFIDNNVSGNDYAYDDNGNMTMDYNKDITGISYNHLNLPETVTFAGGRSIIYTYDAAGIKLAKAANDNGNITTTDYVSGFIYTDNELIQIAHAEGRLRSKSSGGFAYDYYIKDHLGNTRITFTADNEEVIYLATMETDNDGTTDFKAYEDALFLNMDASRTGSFAVANTTAEPNIINDETSLLNGADDSRRLGPGQNDAGKQGRYAGFVSKCLSYRYLR